MNHDTKEKQLFIGISILLFIILILLFVKIFENKKEYANQPTYEIVGTNLKFKEMDHIYTCKAGVTYMIGSERVPVVILLDENGKPRSCHVI